MLLCPHCNEEGISFIKKVFSRQSIPVICSICGKPSFLNRKRNEARILLDFLQVFVLFGFPVFLLKNGYGLNSIIVFAVLYVVLNVAYSVYWRYKAPLIESCEFRTTWARKSNAIFFGLVGLLVLFIVIMNTK